MISRVLFVGGSDSGAGAGIQADLKTAMALGAYGTTAVTAVTAQNSREITAIRLLPAALVRAQIDAVIDDLGCDAIKTGMLGRAATVRIVARAADQAAVPLIVDPVLRATSGTDLFDAPAVDALRRHILPRACLITPNRAEAAALTGESDPIAAGQKLLAMGASAALVTGGDAATAELTDWLITGDGTRRFSHRRIDSRHTHGTGCSLAAAIATRLAQGCALVQAVGEARSFVRRAIAQAPGLGAGHGPLGHGLP